MKFAPRKGTYIKQINGHWHYRREIPKRWRSIIGKREWWQKLGQISEAEARRKARLLAVDFDRLIADLEAMGEETAKCLRIDKLRQMARTALIERPHATDEIDHILIRELRALGYKPSPAEVAKRAAAFLRAGLDTVDDPEERELDELRIEKHEREAAQLEATTASRTLLTAMDDWRAMRKQGDDTWRKHVQRVKDFVEFLGRDKAFTQVTVEDADRFIHHVATTPDHRGKLRTGTTVKKYRDSLSAYFRWAAKRPGWGVTNVFADVEVPKDARPKQAQTFDSFTDAQAMEYRSVARELWTRREKLEQVNGRTRDLRNVIDIMIGLGLRPKEACQLHSSNVIEDNGGLVLDITTLIDESDPVWRPSLKTDHSVRQLPVPDELVSLVEEQVAAANGEMLFPTFANLKKYTGPLERDVADHIKPKCSFAKNPRLVTYSHRHRFRDLCAKAGLPYQIFLAVFGHADDNPTTSRYGDKSKWNAEKLVWLNRVFPLAFPNGR